MAENGFAACLAEVLKLEGGYADNPLDPGGATNMGITRRTLAAWRKVTPWWTLPKTAVRTLTRAEAAEIYRKLYWDICHAEQMPAGLDLALFDFAVHSGPVRAVKTLQSIVGTRPDGLVGPKTLAALRLKLAAMGVGALIDALCGRRLGFLEGLAGALVFGRGWRRRVETIRSAARARAGLPASPSTPQARRQALDFLSGYKTYIVGALMILTGLAQLLGVAIPSFDGHTAGQLLMEGAAIVFLRKGISAGLSGGGGTGKAD